MIDEIKNLITEKHRRHLYSFAKTYVTVFLTLYLKDVTEQPGELALFNLAIIVPAMKWAFIAVIRNIFKLLTED